MLTGDEILKRMGEGQIVIAPFRRTLIGPNSVDVTLSRHMLRCVSEQLDVRQAPDFQIVTPQKDGDREYFYLQPGEFYLGATEQWFHCGDLIPGYEGRSTLARYGVMSHLTAGFGDVGFEGHWTLELAVVKPIVLDAGMRIGQVYFHEPQGATTIRYGGRYSNTCVDTGESYPRVPEPHNI